MELVQVFASRPHQKTLIFLSTEDASSGGLGIDHFLSTSELTPSIATILSFQGLGKERTRVLQAGVTAPQNTTPGWYVQLGSRVLLKSGLALQVPGLPSQAADHALSLSSGDQVAGLSRGIASLRLYDETGGNPTAAGLSTQGAAIERLIMSLDAEPEIPTDPGTALVLRSGRYLTSRAVALLATLMLLPTIAVLLIWLFSSRITTLGALMHVRNLFSFAIPLALVFVLAYALAQWSDPRVPRSGAHLPGPATDPRMGRRASSSCSGSVLRLLPALPGLLEAARIAGGHGNEPPLRGVPQPAVRARPDVIPFAVPTTAVLGVGVGLAAHDVLRGAGLLRSPLATSLSQ
jgi:hypothetical protein